MHNAFGMEEVDVEELFKLVDADQDGIISFGRYLRKAPHKRIILLYLPKCSISNVAKKKKNSIYFGKQTWSHVTFCNKCNQSFEYALKRYLQYFRELSLPFTCSDSVFFCEFASAGDKSCHCSQTYSKCPWSFKTQVLWTLVLWCDM